jgi:hypothetical protein
MAGSRRALILLTCRRRRRSWRSWRDNSGGHPTPVQQFAQDRLALLHRLRSDTLCSVDFFRLDLRGMLPGPSQNALVLRRTFLRPCGARWVRLCAPQRRRTVQAHRPGLYGASRSICQHMAHGTYSAHCSWRAFLRWGQPRESKAARQLWTMRQQHHLMMLHHLPIAPGTPP